MAVMTEFFNNLAWRRRKENDLSDITWALCWSSEYFQRKFLLHCFGKEISGIDSFEREYASGDCRPDFYIKCKDGNEYLIEIKIYDRNTHFEKYEKEFPHTEKSFLANYKQKNRSGWKIKNWNDFSKTLSQLKDIPKEDNDLIQGYIAYLNSVIYYTEVKPMNFKNVTSLLYFYDALGELFENCKVFPLTAYNTSSKAIDCYMYGRYAYYTNAKGENVYFWIGLWFVDETRIYFMIDHYNDESWCPKKEAKIIENLKDGKYFDGSGIEGNRIWVGLKDEYNDAFNREESTEKQKEILRGFLEEILGSLK
jgi:hypothetical protein